MSSTKKELAAERKAAAQAAAAAEFTAGARYLPIMALAWIGLIAATAIAALCPRFTAFYAAYIAICLALCAGALAFLDAIYRKRKAYLHPAFKKFLGYGLVLHYAASALPRVDWASSGLIGQGYVVYMFILAMICLAAGLALFIACGRPAAFAALGLITEAEAADRNLRKKRFAADRKKGFVHGTLEWVDALGFAAILVILVNTFVFQLYVIPSESMVPTFLKQDRPFTVKFSAGPKIPLTDWRLPFMKLPARGDVITLSNPRYPENQSVNLKKYLSQLVSMITFTAVNIDRKLPNGGDRADPLVKRIVGLPGEQLMMVDDILYSRREGEAAFSPVVEDAKWARVDLWKESPELRRKIESIRIDEATRSVLSAWDAKKNGADIAGLSAAIASTVSSLPPAAKASKAESIFADMKKTAPVAYSLASKMRSELDLFVAGGANPISERATGFSAYEVLGLVLSLPGSAPARAALADYARASSAPASDAFERGSRALNLIIKKNAIDRIARCARLVASGASIDAISNDKELASLEKERRELNAYLQNFDVRNFGPFPAGNAYLGPTEYFAMGDNRYNSIDFRMRDDNDYTMTRLDPEDPSSIIYPSNIDPFALDLKYIEGYALFRIWPPSRVGALK